MPTPREGYFLADGTRVPGTTTVIGRFKDAGPLIYWAWMEGKEGRDFRETRDRAANIGTVAHAMMEAHIRGREFNPAEFDAAMVEAAKKPFAVFLEWAGDTKLAITDPETRLVSEEYKYGGTLDGCAIRGSRSVADWKTSKGVYSDYLLQLAAYKHLWDENHPWDPIEGGAHLVRFDKESGDFAHHYYADLSDEWEAFKRMIPLYGLMKKIEKRK